VKDPREEGFLIEGGCWEGGSCHRRWRFVTWFLVEKWIWPVCPNFILVWLKEAFWVALMISKTEGSCLPCENMCLGRRSYFELIDWLVTIFCGTRVSP
jgi:hypothetical protein